MKLWPITVKKPNREQEAFNKGQEDWMLGQPYEANPYLGDEMRDAWQRGWSDANLRSYKSIQP